MVAHRSATPLRLRLRLLVVVVVACVSISALVRPVTAVDPTVIPPPGQQILTIFPVPPIVMGMTNMVPGGTMNSYPMKAFTLPAGKQCTRLWIMFNGLRCYSRGLGKTPLDPVAIRFSIFPAAAPSGSNRPNISSPSLIGYPEAAAPYGGVGWNNMTNFVRNTTLACTYGFMVQWFSVSLETAPGGYLAGGPQQYWLSVSFPPPNGTNSYSFFPGPNQTPMVPDLAWDLSMFSIGDEGSRKYALTYNLSLTPRITMSTGSGSTTLSNLNMAMGLFAQCTAAANDPLIAPHVVPPPVCRLKATSPCAQNLAACVWTCPSVDFEYVPGTGGNTSLANNMGSEPPQLIAPTPSSPVPVVPTSPLRAGAATHVIGGAMATIVFPLALCLLHAVDRIRVPFF